MAEMVEIVLAGWRSALPLPPKLNAESETPLRAIVTPPPLEENVPEVAWNIKTVGTFTLSEATVLWACPDGSPARLLPPPDRVRKRTTIKATRTAATGMPTLTGNRARRDEAAFVFVKEVVERGCSKPSLTSSSVGLRSITLLTSAMFEAFIPVAEVGFVRLGSIWAGAGRSGTDGREVGVSRFGIEVLGTEGLFGTRSGGIEGDARDVFGAPTELPRPVPGSVPLPAGDVIDPCLNPCDCGGAAEATTGAVAEPGGAVAEPAEVAEVTTWRSA